MANPREAGQASQGVVQQAGLTEEMEEEDGEAEVSFKKVLKAERKDGHLRWWKQV